MLQHQPSLEHKYFSIIQIPRSSGRAGFAVYFRKNIIEYEVLEYRANIELAYIFEYHEKNIFNIFYLVFSDFGFFNISKGS
jgi:hypothetical protein